MSGQHGPALDRDVQRELGSRLRRRFDDAAADASGDLDHLMAALREREAADEGARPEGDPRH